MRAKGAKYPLRTIAITLFFDPFRAFKRLSFINPVNHELNADGDRTREARTRGINSEVMESLRCVVAAISDVLDPVVGRRWAAKFLD